MNQLVPDDELIEQIRFKNDLALDLLLKKYELFVQSWISLILKGHIYNDREDLLQIGMLAVYESIDNYDPRLGNFYNFAKSIAVFEMRDAYLDEIEKPHYYSLNDNMVAYLADNYNPFIYENQRMHRIEELMITLKNSRLICDEFKEIFILYVKGYSYLEISQILNISLKRVDNAIQRVRKVLTKRFY